MVFHGARLKSFNPPILINGTQLQEVTSTKYPGLIIDNTLKWIDHIAHMWAGVTKGPFVGIFISKKMRLYKTVQKFSPQKIIYVNLLINIVYYVYVDLYII